MAYRQLPTVSRRIGFEISPPREVVVQPQGAAVRCRQQEPDGRPIGELELEVFQAALVIDRDGILEEKIHAAAHRAAGTHGRVLQAVPIELPGASGYRADIELVRPPGGVLPALPYVYVFAIAPHDLGVDGGLLVTVRSASPEWPAADTIMQSLRILSRHGATANE